MQSYLENVPSKSAYRQVQPFCPMSETVRCVLLNDGTRWLNVSSTRKHWLQRGKPERLLPTRRNSRLNQMGACRIRAGNVKAASHLETSLHSKCRQPPFKILSCMRPRIKRLLNAPTEIPVFLEASSIENPSAARRTALRCSNGSLSRAL